jgi:hypothetical protein
LIPDSDAVALDNRKVKAFRQQLLQLQEDLSAVKAATTAGQIAVTPFQFDLGHDPHHQSCVFCQ